MQSLDVGGNFQITINKDHFEIFIADGCTQHSLSAFVFPGLTLVSPFDLLLTGQSGKV